MKNYLIYLKCLISNYDKNGFTWKIFIWEIRKFLKLKVGDIENWLSLYFKKSFHLSSTKINLPSKERFKYIRNKNIPQWQVVIPRTRYISFRSIDHFPIGEVTTNWQSGRPRRNRKMTRTLYMEWTIRISHFFETNDTLEGEFTKSRILSSRKLRESTPLYLRLIASGIIKSIWKQSLVMSGEYREYNL